MNKNWMLLAMGLTLYSNTVWSQSWVPQAKKAVFSIITYDKNGDIKNTGNGFYISDNGIGLSDYKLFQDAAKAVVVDGEGSKSEVSYILGANDMYDVVKFQVKTNKKTTALDIAAAQATQSQTVYMLPYSTQKNTNAQKVMVKEVSSVAGDYAYYTLNSAVSDKNVSCPLMNAEGKVLGLIQKGTDSESYSMDANYASKLEINVLSASDYILNSIGIAKGLPADEDQALVYLMTAKGQPSYAEQLELFIQRYPENAEGYLRRATLLVDKQDFEKAETDLNTYMDKCSDKAEAHYNIGFLINSKCTYYPEPAYKDWSVEKALSEIEEAISLNASAVYIKTKADILYTQGQYEKAYEAYAQLLDTDLKGAAIYSFMAQCKINQNAPEEEILELMDKSMEFFTKPYDTNVSTYLYNRAIHRTYAGKYREAVIDFNDLEHIYGGRGTAEFYLYRGKAEVQCRMYQQALDDYTEASQLAPQSQEVLIEKAGLELTIKDFAAAINTANKLIELDSNDPYGYRFLGFAQVNSGKKTEGKQNLLKAKELGDPNADAIIQKYCK